MGDDTKHEEAEPAEKASKPALIRLHHPAGGSYPLSIGKRRFAVEDGVVDVPIELIEAAEIAGFQRG